MEASASEKTQATRMVKTGRVVSDKMDKTVVVAVDYRRQHPIYKKALRRTSRFKAHDEQNQYQIGDIVRIEEIRPLSRTKKWIVRELIERPTRV
jgi:small subunit ribosomal protein S17